MCIYGHVVVIEVPPRLPITISSAQTKACIVYVESLAGVAVTTKFAPVIDAGML
jgi:hypothetical protein